MDLRKLRLILRRPPKAAVSKDGASWFETRPIILSGHLSFETLAALAPEDEVAGRRMDAPHHEDEGAPLGFFICKDKARSSPAAAAG